MRIFSFAYSYLTLVNERGRPIYLRDLLGVIAIAALIALPFLMVPGAPFFSKDGFLDKFAAFSGVLTGFYVAALIAVATLVSSSANLDDPIESGPVFFSRSSRAGKSLSRRQYVCLMFGYLAFLSVVMALLSVLSVSLVSALNAKVLGITILQTDRFSLQIRDLRPVVVGVISLMVAHMVVTTLHGLYYLTDRLYARRPKMLPRPVDLSEDENH